MIKAFRTDEEGRQRSIIVSCMWCCLSVVLLSVWSCQRPMPRPVGYERMTFDPTAYTQTMPVGLPFAFEVERNALIRTFEPDGEYRSVVLEYPAWKAVILCTYCRMTPETFPAIAAESYELVFRHTVMANSIDKELIAAPTRDVYGTLYHLSGKVATPYQVELTDSVRHFFRASLTVNTSINTDSLAPLYERLLDDIRHMVTTFRFRTDVH